jgi:general secretion pathway protein D
MVSVLSYGTVLDVQAIASSDRRYITMTLRPQDARVGVWRRFGPAVEGFPGGPVDRMGNGIAYIPGLLEYPLMVPQMVYHAVQTTVTIPDGGALLIGGMNRSNVSRAHTGVPFLSHIPFLGRLFSSNGRTEQELKEFIYVSGDIILLEEIEERL